MPGDVACMPTSGFNLADPHVADASDDLVSEAIRVFQPYYPEPLGREGGAEIKRNLGDVLLLLAGWRDQDAPPSADPAPIATEPPGIRPAAPPRRPKRRKFPAEIP